MRNELVQEFLPFGRRLARRYAGRGIPLEDLEQVALLALVKSVERFDPDRGVKFTTFAGRTIMGELKRHFRDHGWAVRVPRRDQELTVSIRNTTEILSQELGRTPTANQLAERLGESVDRIVAAMDAASAYRSESFSVDSGAGTTAVREPGQDEEGFDGVERRLVLSELLVELPERERGIIELRYFHGMTQSDIAGRLGISQVQVSRLLRRTLDRLRVGLDS